jgi:hypothetical protein
MAISRDGEAGVSAIDDHRFAPRDHWYSLCRVCALAEAAHVRSSILHPATHNYRCPDCVTKHRDRCPHR